MCFQIRKEESIILVSLNGREYILLKNLLAVKSIYFYQLNWLILHVRINLKEKKN